MNALLAAEAADTTARTLTITLFLVFVAVTLGITVWASRQTKTATDYYAGGRSFSGFQNGMAIGGDYMSAASFLGIAGIIALYVLLSAYARGFMGVKIVGNINVALVFGLLQFVSTFLIAWLYSRYAEKNLDPVADRRIDPVADRIRAEIGEVTHEHGPRG